MKKIIVNMTLLSLLAAYFTACKENNKTENFEDRLENKSDDLENRSDEIEDWSDDFEDASDDIGRAAKDIEEAMDNFRDALEEMDNREYRKTVRKRINAILDSLEVE